MDICCKDHPERTWWNAFFKLKLLSYIYIYIYINHSALKGLKIKESVQTLGIHPAGLYCVSHRRTVIDNARREKTLSPSFSEVLLNGGLTQHASYIGIYRCMKLYRLQTFASGFETQTLESVIHNVGLNFGALLRGIQINQHPACYCPLSAFVNSQLIG